MALLPLFVTLPWLLNYPCPDVDPVVDHSLLTHLSPVHPHFRPGPRLPRLPRLSLLNPNPSHSSALLTSKEDEAKTFLVDSSPIPPLCPSSHSREAGWNVR